MRRRSDTALALGVFVAVAIGVTWPLIGSATHALAGGLGDPLLGSVLLAWDADRFRHAFQGLWDAPYLFPQHHTLAYTEHLIGIAIFTAPIEWATANPILAYNAAYIGSYGLAGFGMFLLARALWGRTDAALLAGLAFAVTPYRLAQTTHLQVLINGWMPIALLGLHRYFASGERRWIALFAAAYAILGLSNGYYLYFFLLPIAVLVAIELVWPRVPRARMLTDMAIAAACVAVVVAPVAWVYYTLQRGRGFVRSLDDLPGLSAHLTDYLRVGSGAWTWGGLLELGGPERELFHGFVALAFAVVGACTVLRPNDTAPARGSWSRAYLLITVLAVWLSMGPGPGMPYALLFYVVPGFSGLRVPARLSAVVIVGIAVLAGAGFAWLFARLSRRTAAVVAVACGVLMLVEGQHGLGLSEVGVPGAKTWEHAAYDWLRDSPPGAVLELDITRLNDFHPFTTMYQLNTLRHHHAIVNGYAGWPTELQELLGDGTSPVHEAGQMADVLHGLRAIGVRYVVLHEQTFLRRADAARLIAEMHAARDQVIEEHRFGDVWVWRLQAPTNGGKAAGAPAGDGSLRRLDPGTFTLRASTQEGRLPMLVDGDVETRWLTGAPQSGEEWIEVRFARPINVARLQIDTAARAIVDYPRRLTVESIDAAGRSRPIFDGSIVDRLVEAAARDEQRAPVTLDFGDNDSVAIRIRQTGHSSAWWSVFEMALWERRPL